MIGALFWLAQIVAGPLTPAVPGEPAALAPAVVLARYAAALDRLAEPKVISFDYTLEQSGLRTLEQTHRVFRSGSDERDETLTVDGKKLTRPIVRIFRGRRNRYTVRLLAPRTADYDFIYVGPRRDAHHLDYVFRLAPKTRRAFAVTTIDIDGVRFLPNSIDFTTRTNEGAGTIVFGSNARWWVPYYASARATVAADVATERLTFYTYRFPRTLPPSTFGMHRAAAAAVPTAPAGP